MIGQNINPSYWLRDNNDNVVLISVHKSFPQPEQGMLVPDYRMKQVLKIIMELLMDVLLIKHIIITLKDIILQINN